MILSGGDYSKFKLVRHTSDEMGAHHSQLVATALAVIDGYNKWDIDAIMAPRAPNCTHQVLPHRLGRPLLNNTQYREYFLTSAIPYFSNFTVTVNDLSEDKHRHQVYVHASSTADSVIGAYANEYVLLLTMTEDDKQLVHFGEFVDSGYSESFFPRLAEWIAQQNETQAEGK